MGILDFLGDGQNRRRALDEAASELMYYIPPHLREAFGLVAEMNPVQGIGTAMGGARTAADPSYSPEQRRQGLLDAAIGTGIAAVPTALAARGYAAPAAAVIESFLGGSPASMQLQEDAGRLAADAIGAGRAVASGDLGLLGEVIQPGREARSLSARGIGDNGGPPMPTPMPRSFSQALKSVRELKQNKGSYDQFRAALIKAGVKPDELQWTGADSTFRGQKVTKDELEQFFLDASDALGEEVRVGGRSGEYRASSDPDLLVERYVEIALPDEIDYYRYDVLPEWLASNAQQVSDLDDEELQTLADNMDVTVDYLRERPDFWVNDQFNNIADEESAILERYGTPEEIAEESLRQDAYYEARRDPDSFARDRLGMDEDELYSNVEYPQYFPKGGVNYAERLYTYSDPTERLDYGQMPSQGHFDEPPEIVANDEGAFLGWARTADFPVEGGGTAYYIGEAQSDIGQRLRNRMRTTGSTARDYDQTLGVSAYENAVRPLAREAMADYYKLAEAWNDLPAETRASELTRLQLQNFNDDMARQSDDFVSLDSIDAMDEAGYDAFNQWRDQNGWPRNLGTIYNPDSAATIARGYGTGYSGQPLLDDALDAYRASHAARDTAREEQLGLLGFDPDKTLASAPFADSTQKFTDFILRRNLEDAIRSKAEYMAIPYQKEAIGNVGGGTVPTEGSLDYYRNIMPKRLEKLAQRYDKSAKLEPITMVGQRGNERIPATGLRLTPEFIEEVRKKGIPLWMLGGTGMFGSGLLGSYNQDQQPSSGLLGGM